MPPNQPIQQPTQPVPPPQSSASGQKKKRIIIGAVVGVAALVALSLGAVFGLVLPNQPDNVWSTGLSRTGKTVDRLVEEGTTQEKLDAYKSSELVGNVEVKTPQGDFKADVGSKYDAKKSDSTLSYKGADQDLSIRVMSDLADGKLYPDVYFQVNGIAKLGLDAFVPGVSAYDGKWIAASSDYLATVIPAEAKDAKQDTFTEKDATELVKIVSATTQEYVLTSDKSKAVIEQRSFVGTEKIDNDITANHYTAGVNIENAKKYCKALIERVMAADAYKRIPGVDASKVEEDKTKALKDCDESATKDIKAEDTFDLWIDKKTKLISKARFTDKDEAGTYVEVGQTYKKGDVIPVFFKLNSDKDKYTGTLNIEANTKANTTKMTLKAETTGDQKVSGTASLELKPFKGDIKVDKPGDSIPLEQVLQQFGIDPKALQGAAAPSSL